MRFRTHLAFGLLAGLVFRGASSIGWYAFFPLVLFGALLPDIDEPNSKFGRKLGFFSKVLNFIAGHRGITHGIWLPLILGLSISIAFGLQYGIPLFIGYISHVLIDGLTVQGVNLLHPVSRLHISGFIRTGGAWEMVVFVLILVIIAIKVVGIIH